MAEQVSSLLRRSVEHLADEVPDSYRLVLASPRAARGGARRRRRTILAVGRTPTLGHRRRGRDRAYPDHHLPGRHPRRAGREGRARGGRRGGHGERARLAGQCPACARHSARIRPRRGSRTVAARTAGRTPGGTVMSEAIPTPASCKRRPTVAVLGAGIAGLTAAHELAERGFEVTVYEPARTSAPSWVPSLRAPIRRSSSAASPLPSTRRWALTTEAPPSCAPFRAGGASPRHRGERLRASTASASSRRTTCTSGTCSSASRSTSARSRWRRGQLESDLTHRHGQRQAGGHPGHHRGRQTVPCLSP